MIINIPLEDESTLSKENYYLRKTVGRKAPQIFTRMAKSLPVNSRQMPQKLPVACTFVKGAAKVQLGAVQIFSLKCEKHSNGYVGELKL